ncbi:MAG: hypothetical protein JWQ71_2023 [Pedosphaera sp.]|nr:hypothetical protein [Pedosphaera sp.]
MRVAFKEWAVIVDALGRGEQIVILRKGGISEGRGGFKPEHSEFLLFSTLFHQQRESVVASAQECYDTIAPNFPPADRLRLEFFAKVVAAQRLDSLDKANSLHGQHVWRDEVIAERFDWGRDKTIYAMAVRIFRSPSAIELPMLAAYGGCKSWIEIDQEILTDKATPVLTDAAFTDKLKLFLEAVGCDESSSDVVGEFPNFKKSSISSPTTAA